MAYIGTKKIILWILLSVVVVLGGLWLVGRFAKGDETTDAAEKSASDIALAALVGKDSDSDGLKDWEEALWKTDPSKTDTDGDGTNDGDEVAVGRDPAKPGPKDELSKEEVATKATTTPQNLTATDQFARQFFTNYLAVRSQSDLSSQDQTEIFSSLLDDVNTLLKPRTYSASDFEIISESALNTQIRRTYGNELGTILTKPKVVWNINELAIINLVLSENDTTYLDRLPKAAGEYKTMISEMLKTKVPADVAALHAALATDFEALAAADLAMSKIESDPVLALAGIRLHADYVSAVSTNLSALDAYFQNKTVVFDPSEPGYAITK